MATNGTRLYMVEDTEDKGDGMEGIRLVEASHPGAALRHVVGKRFKVNVPTQKQLFSVASYGIKVEQAAESQPE